jgi:hypothetical protein
MSARLDGRAIAILAADGLDRGVVERSRRAIEHAGGLAVVVARAGTPPFARDGDPVAVDATLGSAVPSDFDALVLPTTTASPRSPEAASLARWFVRGFVTAGKPIAVILAEPERPSAARRCAGAIVDGALVTCRGAAELMSALDALFDRIAQRRGLGLAPA